MTASACGLDWTENPTTGECYRIEVQEMIFQDAHLHCTDLYYSEGQSRPDLVSIYSAEEQTFVFSESAGLCEAEKGIQVLEKSKRGRNEGEEGRYEGLGVLGRKSHGS